MKKIYLNTLKHKLIFSFLGFAIMAVVLISIPGLYKSQEALIELALKDVRNETLNRALSTEDALK